MKKSPFLCLMLLSSLLSAQKTGELYDERDGRVYRTVRIGTQWWMSENLNYGTRINGSLNQTNNSIAEKYCFNNLESNCDTLGALYQWDEMMNYTAYELNQGICPDGWHVPSDNDWKELEIFLGMSAADADLAGFRGTDQGTQLKAGGTSGFNARLDGYMLTADNFVRYGTGNCFWTATDLYARYLLNTSAQVYRWNTPLKSYGMSLRCVMDYPFTATTIVLPQVHGSVTRWGDYDRDGDMDLYLSGTTAHPNGICDIYRNNGNGTFTALGEAFERASSSADWGDFDCDGDADLIIAGYSFSATEYITRLYRNDGTGVFSDYPIDVPGAYRVKWGDYDSDGDPDILLNRADPFLNLNQNDGKIEIYENKGTGTYQRADIYFEKAETDFISLWKASFDWGDYNNDGFQDIVVSGEDDIYNRYCKIYKNNGNKTFTDLNLLLRGASEGRVNWGDFDNDNDLDILLTGSYHDLQVYKNECCDIFKPINTGLAERQEFSSWLDFNNDGNLDILGAGATQPSAYSGNGAGVFEYKPFFATEVSHPDIDIADYDNDNDLDFVYSGWATAAYTQIYSNNTHVVNHTPQIPSGLTARQNGADVVFSWNPATDYENGKNLSYNITAGTSSGNCIIISSLSDLSNGKRLKLNRGNVGYDTTWILKNAPLGTLYWSVQSIDKTLKSSGFANFEQFEVKPPFTGKTIGNELSNIAVSGSSFIDANNDGLLDILTSGSNTLGMIPTKEVYCYINQGNNTFTPGTISGPRLVGKFIPCNLNGDAYMDALLYGADFVPTGVGHSYNTVQKIYGLINNTAGDFTVSTGDFAGIQSWALTPGDFDNDGNDEIFVIGYKNDTSGTYLFKKEGTGYTIHDLGLKFNYTDQSVFACDVDNDLDLDISYGPYILINDGEFIKSDVFPYNSIYAMDWGDFDDDGDLDAALSGTDTIGNLSTQIYENSGNLNFSPVKITTKAFAGRVFLRWLDFNNDGLLDLVASGMRDSYHAYIYLNKGNGSFEETDYPDYDARDCGDFDDDGDLDMLGGSMIYISNGDWINNLPLAPSGLTYTLDEFDVLLSWDRAVDAENSDGLSYNVKIGTGEVSFDVMQVLTSAEGHLRIPRIGNAQTNTGWRLKNLPLGDYYWSVQTVDQGYKGGPWAPEQRFTVSYVSANFTADTVCEGFPTTFTDYTVTTEGNVSAWNWDFGDGGSSTVRNPTHVFDHGGFHDVTLTAYAGGYEHRVTKTVFVRHKPHSGFTTVTVCEHDKTNFINSSDTGSISVATWRWSFGDGDLSYVRSGLEHLYPRPGNYTVKLLITATNGCSDSLIKQVIVGKYPNATIGLINQDQTVKLCVGDSSTLTVEYISRYHYQWKKDGINLTNETFNFLVVKNAGNYSVVVTNPLGNCMDTSAIIPVSMIETPPQLTISAASDTNICQGNSVYIEVPFDADYSYLWTINGQLVLNETSNGLNAEKEGSYTVVLSNSSCETPSQSKQVVYKPGLPKPGLHAYGPNAWYLICSIEHVKYKWYYNETLVAVNDKSIFYAGSNLGKYYVEVNDGYECWVPSDKVVIPLVPTGISLADGKNEFYVYPNPADDHIRIFCSGPFTGRTLIRIYDAEGRIVMEQEVNKDQLCFSMEIGLSGLTSGIYIIELYSDEVILKTRFMIM